MLITVVSLDPSLRMPLSVLFSFENTPSTIVQTCKHVSEMYSPLIGPAEPLVWPSR